MMKHTPWPWKARAHETPLWVVTAELHQWAAVCLTSQDNDQNNAELIALAPTAPHECDPECPGDVNRRKLEAFDGLLAALMGCHDALQELCPTENIADIGGWLDAETGNPSWLNLFIEVEEAISRAAAIAGRFHGTATGYNLGVQAACAGCIVRKTV